MQTTWNVNRITLHGTVGEEPKVSHVNHAETFYIFPLYVSRLSGVEDHLNVIVSEALLQECPLKAGSEVTIYGEVRSFNNKSGVGSRLVITVFARELRREQAEDENALELSGTLCKEPVYRRTPLGRDICDMMLAVNRRYGRADYLPCIAWGGLAVWCSQLDVGNGLKLNGRLQSREYTKEVGGRSERRTAYEVSVMSLDPIDKEK